MHKVTSTQNGMFTQGYNPQWICGKGVSLSLVSFTEPGPQAQQVGDGPITEVVGKATHHDERNTNGGNIEDEPVA